MRMYQWNLSYQRQVASRMLLEVTYTGNKTDHIWVAGYEENPAIYIPGNCVAGQYGLTAAGPCSNTSADQPAGARAADAAQSDRGQVLLGDNVEQGTSMRPGTTTA